MVKDRIETLGGISAHAGLSEWVEWAASIGPDTRTYLVHGEPRAQDALADRLWRDHGIRVEIPQRGQSIVI